MGAVTGPEPQHRSAIPGTPPRSSGVNSPSPSILSKQSQDRERDRQRDRQRDREREREREREWLWNSTTPVSPPMSNHDPPSRAEMAGGMCRIESQPPHGRDHRESGDVRNRGKDQRHIKHSSRGSGQQLPSFGSLFGAIQTPSYGPILSPLSDRPSSHAGSPLVRTFFTDGPHSASSYFAPTPFTSGPQTCLRNVLDPRADQRAPPSAYPAVARPVMAPGARRHRNREATGYARACCAPPDLGIQNGYGGPSRGVYPLTSSHDGYHPPMQMRQLREDDYSRHCGEPHTAICERTVPGKDMLGPKIWTGTQFLPRYVKTVDVPGEGLCHFYDDGTHCKAVIDGEHVNAQWGVTKAGKPRKRLAIACGTCREKKIKCDPDYPRCGQCEKFGRVCKFKNAPRGGPQNVSPSTLPAELDNGPPRLSGIMKPAHFRPINYSGESAPPLALCPPVRPEDAARMQLLPVSMPPHPPLPSIGPPPPRPFQMPSNRSNKKMRLVYDQRYLPPLGTVPHAALAVRTVHHDVPPITTPRPPITAAAMPTRPVLVSALPGTPAEPWRQPPELPRIHEHVLNHPWQNDSRPRTLIESPNRSDPTKTKAFAGSLACPSTGQVCGPVTPMQQA